MHEHKIFAYRFSPKSCFNNWPSIVLVLKIINLEVTGKHCVWKKWNISDNAHNVILVFIRRRPNVMDVVKTLRKRCVRTGL